MALPGPVNLGASLDRLPIVGRDRETVRQDGDGRVRSMIDGAVGRRPVQYPEVDRAADGLTERASEEISYVAERLLFGLLGDHPIDVRASLKAKQLAVPVNVPERLLQSTDNLPDV